MTESAPLSASTPTGPGIAALAGRLPGLTIRDEHRLGRRLELARRLSGTRRGREFDAIRREIERAEQRIAVRRAAAPSLSYPPELPVSQRIDDLAATIREHQVVVVAGETGSGQVHPAAQGLPGHRARRPRLDRPYPTPPHRRQGTGRAHRRGDRYRTRRRGRLHHPVRRPHQRLDAGPADDRRHPAGPDRPRSRPARLRHGDHRRGARAQPQHRLPARLPRAAAAQAARPEGHHHLGHHRPGEVRRPFRGPPIVEVSGRTFPVEIRYRPFGPAESDDADDAGAMDIDGDGETGPSAGGANDSRPEFQAVRAPRSAAGPVAARSSGRGRRSGHRHLPGRRRTGHRGAG